MKKNYIKRFNESDSEWTISKRQQELIDAIKTIISNEVYLRDVPYSMQEGDMEKDPDSIDSAAKEIVKMLDKMGFSPLNM